MSRIKGPAATYFRVHAKMLVPVMVAKSMDGACGGRFQPGDRPLAVAALRDALTEALKARSDGRHFVKIEREVFMDFPGTKPEAVPDPSACWLGVAIDELGHVVFAVDELGPVPDDPERERYGAIAWLKWRLQMECPSAHLLGPSDYGVLFQ